MNHPPEPVLGSLSLAWGLCDIKTLPLSQIQCRRNGEDRGEGKAQRFDSQSWNLSTEENCPSSWESKWGTLFLAHWDWGAP